MGLSEHRSGRRRRHEAQKGAQSLGVWGRPVVRAQILIGVQRLGEQGKRGGVPGEQRTTATRPGQSDRKRQPLRQPTPATLPTPLPAGPSAPAALPASARARCFPPLPAYPLPRTRTDLFWLPSAPPPPSRRLRRILRLLPKLFPLIPRSAAAAAAAASHAAPPGPAPQE